MQLKGGQRTETFLQNDTQMPSDFTERCLVINYYRNVNQNHKDILLQTYQDCKEKKEQQGLGRDVANRTLLVGLSSGSAIVESNWAIIQNIKHRNITQPTLPLLEYTQKKWKYSDTCSYIFTATLRHNSQKAETMQTSINGRMDKTRYGTHVKMDYYLACKINGVLLKSEE